MNQKSLIPLLLFLCIMALSSASFAASEQPPLPVDLNIVPPDSSVPEDLQKFAGKWDGTLALSGRGWSATAAHTFVVESIMGQKAVVIYSRGGYNEGKHYQKPMWKRINAFFEPEKKELMVNYNDDGTYATMTYSLDANGNLKGSGTKGFQNRIMTLKKVAN